MLSYFIISHYIQYLSTYILMNIKRKNKFNKFIVQPSGYRTCPAQGETVRAKPSPCPDLFHPC